MSNEEELGLGHVHKTGSAVCWQAEILIFFGKNMLEWHTKPLSTYVILWGWTCKSTTRGLDSPVSVEERVGLVLWRLATGNSYRSCGLQFGLGKSASKGICSEFEQAMFNLKDRFIKFPVTIQEIRNKMDDFEESYQIPQIMGAINGCHIEINAPPDNREDYFNRKQHYSVNLQGTVDWNLKFMHATVGYPGSIHDAWVLRLSGLYELAENEQILSGPTRNINGTEIWPLLAGDSAYPLRTHELASKTLSGQRTPDSWSEKV